MIWYLQHRHAYWTSFRHCLPPRPGKTSAAFPVLAVPSAFLSTILTLFESDDSRIVVTLPPLTAEDRHDEPASPS